MSSVTQALSARGLTGTLVLTAGSVALVRNSWLAYFAYGHSGSKEVPLRSLSSIEHRAPSWVSYGYIRLVYSGSVPPKPGQWAVHWKDAVVFRYDQRHQFMAMRDALLDVVRAQ